MCINANSPVFKISPVVLYSLEKTRINDSLKMRMKGYFFSILNTCDSMCTCSVSAVGVKTIMFQSFDKY